MDKKTIFYPIPVLYQTSKKVLFNELLINVELTQYC